MLSTRKLEEFESGGSLLLQVDKAVRGPTTRVPAQHPGDYFAYQLITYERILQSELDTISYCSILYNFCFLRQRTRLAKIGSLLCLAVVRYFFVAVGRPPSISPFHEYELRSNPCSSF